jgi:hypothetical protein
VKTLTFLTSTEKPYLWLLIALPLFLPSLIVPMSSDNSLYHSMAYDLLTFGKMPYLGSWDQNFPGIVIIHAFVLSVFGGSDLAFRIFDVIYQLAFCALLFKTLRAYGSSIALAGFSIVLYAVYYGRNDYMFFGQRELFAHGVLLLGIWYRQRKPGHALVPGLLLGFAILIKPTVAVVGVPFLWLILPNPAPWKFAIRLGLATCIPLILVVVIYSFFPGGVSELYLATIRFNADVYSGSIASLWAFFAFTQRNAYFYPLAVLGIWYVLKNSERSRILFVYASTIVLSVLVVLVQGRLLIYHYSTFFLLLCPIAAVPLEKIYLRLKLKPRYIGFAVIVLMCLFAAKRRGVQAFAANIDKTGVLDSAYNEADPWSVSPPLTVDRVISYLDKYRGVRVEVMSHHARLRDKLRQNSATRFTLLHPIGLYTGAFENKRFTEYQSRWRREFIDSLESVKPEFIVIARNTPCFQLQDAWDYVLKPLPGFESFLKHHYLLDSTIGNFEIYRSLVLAAK